MHTHEGSQLPPKIQKAQMPVEDPFALIQIGTNASGRSSALQYE